jgi:hypothetical protein
MAHRNGTSFIRTGTVTPPRSRTPLRSAHGNHDEDKNTTPRAGRVAFCLEHSFDEVDTDVVNDHNSGMFPGLFSDLASTILSFHRLCIDTDTDLAVIPFVQVL